MKRVIIVGENFTGSIMVDQSIIPPAELGRRVVHYWDEYQATEPDSDDGFIPWLAMIPGFAVDNHPLEAEVVFV